MEAHQVRDKMQAVKEEIEKVLVGKSELLDLILTSVIAGGHILLEDTPGMGKTLMAKTLAGVCNIRFARIQFTPDLLPTDVTGLNYYNQKEGCFVLRKGPIFCNLLLADEINRATPRTQSSLLECMEERQVTIDGDTYLLDLPFFVIATQNPVETAGTFPLPEAQMDRFFMQLSMGMPTREEELLILERFQKGNPFYSIENKITGKEIKELQNSFQDIYVHSDLKQYLLSLVEKTRKDKSIALGISPRGTLALFKAIQAYALLQGRNYALPEDIKRLAVPVLAHRIVLYGGESERLNGKTIIQKFMSEIEVPTENWSGAEKNEK